MRTLFHNTKGSITVLVTLILVPTIFFNGFLVDLARIKLYGNQAVMTADNYGEAILSNYDNLLKELYGLFALSQSDEGKKALDQLSEYMKTSFDPSKETISWNHLAGLAGTTEYQGFMPYKDAEVSLSYTPAQDATLSNSAVFSTQVGDFMKFRIVQTMGEGSTDVMNAITEIQNMEKNSEAIDKRNDLDDKAGEVLEAAQEYYDVIRCINSYPNYIEHLQSAYRQAKEKFEEIFDSDTYQIYMKYTLNRDKIEAALEKQKNLKEGESLTEEEQSLLQMNDDYEKDPEARTGKLTEKFEAVIEEYTDSKDSRPVDFSNLEEFVKELVRRGNRVKQKLGELESLRNDLESVLSDENVSESIRNGMQEELDKIDELFGQDGSYSANNYVSLARTLLDTNIDQNRGFESKFHAITIRLEEIERAWIYLDGYEPDYHEDLSLDDWYDFQKTQKYKELYVSLAKWFENSDDANAKKAKQKKSAAKDSLKDAEEEMDRDAQQTKARDIPESFGFGKKGNAGNFALRNMVKEASSYFSMNSFSDAGNRLLLKLYTVQYDFGMFSSRVTNVKKDDQGNTEEKESLTGYPMAANINYLYQAELEYLFGGYNSSLQNLNSARNKILAFRAIVNYAATYSVTEINSAIKTISELAAAVNPVLGLAVAGALRLAVAGIETVGDWRELKKGEGVVLIKSKLEDLTAYDRFASLLDLDSSSGGSGSSSLKLDYEQYLSVLLVFLTTTSQIAERSANLVCLNVNTVSQNIGSKGKLENLTFKMENAVTAIDASCKVHLDFVVMPQGFAEKVAAEDTYAQLEAFEKNSYQFTVTRGY